MKKILFAIAALAVAFGFTACSNEDETLENGKNGEVFITAFTEAGTTRTALDGDDTKGYDVVWSEGDQFYAYTYGMEGSKTITFTLTNGAGTTKGTYTTKNLQLNPVTDAYTAYYPKGYTGIYWPISQTYTEGNIKGFPMKAIHEAGSSTIQFKNEGGILRLKVSGDKSVKSISVSATGLNNSITLDCGDGVALTSEGTVFHIAMPTGETSTTYSNVVITLTDTDDNTCTKTFKGTGGLVVERSKITTASFTASFVPATPPTDALSGKFSVSETKKVYFAKGNLYYDGSAFKLEENQYSIATSWNSSHVSNFFWSATAADAYASDCYYEEATVGDVFFTNASETTPNASFTVNGQTGVWRTLSNSEWNYLFSHYTYKYTSVCDKSGIVIAPAGVTEIDDDPYDKTDWATAEADGFVFLPNTGYRDGTIISETKISCLYWSSTLNGDGKPYRKFFQWNESKSSLSKDLNDASLCYWAIGIRLVQDVK